MKKILKVSFFIAAIMFGSVVLYIAMMIFSIVFLGSGCGKGYSDPIPSPTGKHAVVGEWSDCGAMSSVNLTYYILPSRGQKLSSINFAKISKNTTFLEGSRLGVSSIEWIDGNTLLLTHTSEYLDVSKTEIDGVKIITQKGKKKDIPSLRKP